MRLLGQTDVTLVIMSREAIVQVCDGVESSPVTGDDGVGDSRHSRILGP